MARVCDFGELGELAGYHGISVVTMVPQVGYQPSCKLPWLKQAFKRCLTLGLWSTLRLHLTRLQCPTLMLL